MGRKRGKEREKLEYSERERKTEEEGEIQRADVAAMVTGVTLERNRTEPLRGKTHCAHTHTQNSSNNHVFIYV